MTHLADHVIPAPLRPDPLPRRRAATSPARRCRCRDQRWPRVAAELARLRAARRRSVRIVDADCGAGDLLLCAVRHARALGFTSIEARGIDGAPALICHAQAAAGHLGDPAIGISFEAADMVCALRDECEFPADIVLWHGCAACDEDARRVITAAGRTLIADPLTGASSAA